MLTSRNATGEWTPSRTHASTKSSTGGMPISASDLRMSKPWYSQVVPTASSVVSTSPNSSGLRPYITADESQSR